MTLPSNTELLSIGSVASATGLAVSAVRYYDELGIIDATTRVGGKRRFHPDVIGRVNFVQRCKEAGFSLEDAASLLDDTTGAWRGLVDEKLEELVEKQRRLTEMIAMLTEIRTCGCDVVSDCTFQSTNRVC